MFKKKPKFPLPDLGDKSLGEMILEIEKRGLIGHFKDSSLFSSFNPKGEEISITRDYWIMAGTDPTPSYKHNLGTEKNIISSVDKSLALNDELCIFLKKKYMRKR